MDPSFPRRLNYKVMISFVSPRSWEAFTSIGTITEVIQTLALVYFSKEYSWLLFWIISCWGRNRLWMSLCLISKSLSFGTQSKIAVRWFPRLSNVVFCWFGFTAGMVCNVVKVSHFVVFRNTEVRWSCLQATFDNSVSLNAQNVSTCTPWDPRINFLLQQVGSTCSFMNYLVII